MASRKSARILTVTMGALLTAIVATAMIAPSIALAATASTAGATLLPTSPAILPFTTGQSYRVYALQLAEGQRATFGMDLWDSFTTKVDLYAPGTTNVSADFNRTDDTPHPLASCGNTGRSGFSYDVPVDGAGTYYLVVIRDPEWLSNLQDVQMTYTITSPAGESRTAAGVRLPASPAALELGLGQGCRVYTIQLAAGQRAILDLDPYSDMGVRIDLYKPGTQSVSTDFEHSDKVTNLLTTCGYGDFANGYFGMNGTEGFVYDVPAGAGGTYYVAFLRDPQWLFNPQTATLTYSVLTPSAPVAGFSAVPTSTSGFEFAPWKFALTWRNPTDSRYVKTRISRYEWYESESFWDNVMPDDESGNVAKHVYEGTGASCIDTLPSDATRYAYAAWTQDTDGNWSVVATMAPYYPRRSGPQFPGTALPMKWNTLGLPHAQDSGNPSFRYHGAIYHFNLEKGQTFAADLYWAEHFAMWGQTWDMRVWAPGATSTAAKPLYSKTIAPPKSFYNPPLDSPQVRFIAPATGTYYLQVRLRKYKAYATPDTWLRTPTYKLGLWKGSKAKLTAKISKVTVTTNSAGNTFIDAYGKISSACGHLVPPEGTTVKFTVYAKGHWDYNYTWRSGIDEKGNLYARIGMPPRSAGRVKVKFVIQPLGLCDRTQSNAYTVRR